MTDFDKDWCIGCKACIAACPYDAIFINPEDHTAEKCNMCAHRLEVGIAPACVVVCPTQAILVGDMNDPNSKVAGIINREVVAVRRPEKDIRSLSGRRKETPIHRAGVRSAWPEEAGPSAVGEGPSTGRRSVCWLERARPKLFH